MGLAEKLNASRAQELGARRFEIKQGLSVWVFLKDVWMIVLQLPVFPNRWYFGWEGTPGTVQDQAGLAEGGRAILLWVL